MRTRLKLLAAACCLVLAACGGDSDDGQTAASAQEAESTETPTPELGPEETTEPAFSVSSADGVVTLDVPAGAVPAGTEITIDTTTAPAGADAAYDFGPDGLEFAEPATLTWTIDGEPESPTAFLLGSISGDGQVEVLQGVETAVADGSTVVTAPVDHFSVIAVRQFEIDIEQVSPGPTVPVGEDFVFRLSASAEAGGDGDLLVVGDLSTEVRLTPSSSGGDWRLEEPTSIGFTCEPVGTFTTAAHVVVDLQWAFGDAEPQTVGAQTTEVRMQTECIDGPAGTLLTVGESPFPDAERLDIPLLVHGDGTTVTITVNESDIPEGGVLGLSFTAPDNDYFVECNFDDRGFPSGCNGFDRNAAPLGSVEATETVNDDGTTTLALPGELFQFEGDELFVFLDGMNIPIESMSVSSFAPDGSVAAGTLLIEEFREAIP